MNRQKLDQKMLYFVLESRVIYDYSINWHVLRKECSLYYWWVLCQSIIVSSHHCLMSTLSSHHCLMHTLPIYHCLISTLSRHHCLISKFKRLCLCKWFRVLLFCEIVKCCLRILQALERKLGSAIFWFNFPPKIWFDLRLGLDLRAKINIDECECRSGEMAAFSSGRFNNIFHINIRQFLVKIINSMLGIICRTFTWDKHGVFRVGPLIFYW